MLWRLQNLEQNKYTANDLLDVNYSGRAKIEFGKVFDAGILGKCGDYARWKIANLTLPYRNKLKAVEDISFDMMLEKGKQDMGTVISTLNPIEQESGSNCLRSVCGNRYRHAKPPFCGVFCDFDQFKSGRRLFFKGPGKPVK